MKIFVITLKIGKIGAGSIVFENILKGLIKNGHDLYLLASEISSDVKVQKLFVLKDEYTLPNKLAKISSIIFRKSLEHFVWQKLVYLKHKNSINLINPDFVLVLAGRGTEGLVNLGMAFSKYMNAPLAVHLVDPIPPPEHYENFEIYRKSLAFGIRKALRYASLVSMGNPEMLVHQQKYLNFDIIKKSMVIRDPIDSEFSYFGPVTDSEIKRILFLGSFSSKRPPDNLIKAFAILCERLQNVELHIVGKNNLNLNKFNLSPVIKNKIVVKSWTNDIDSEIRAASILVDIDIDAVGDVFSSSKLKKYLFYDRIILCVTNVNSPSYNFLKQIKKTVLITSHDINYIADSLTTLVEKEYKAENFTERVSLIDELKSVNSTKKLSAQMDIILEVNI